MEAIKPPPNLMRSTELFPGAEKEESMEIHSVRFCSLLVRARLFNQANPANGGSGQEWTGTTMV